MTPKLLTPLILLFFAFPAMAQDSTIPWIEFPMALLNKRPVFFPVISEGTKSIIPQFLNDNTNYIKGECTRRFAIDYTLQRRDLINDIDQKAPKVEDKVVCFEPELLRLLDEAGVKVQNLSTFGDKIFDAPTTLAASALNVSFNNLRDLPGEASKLLIVLRNLSRNWPTISAKVIEWKGGGSFVADQLRLISPWLTEFSSYSALIKFRAELPCTETEGSPRCLVLKKQIENILQLSIVRINNTPEIKKFLQISRAEKTQILPQIKQIYALDTLFSSTLDDQPGLKWRDMDVTPSSDQLWSSDRELVGNVLKCLSLPMKPGTASTALPAQLFVARLERLAKDDKIPNLSADMLAARSLAYGIHSVYVGGSAAVAAEIIDKYLNLKIFLDLEKKAALHSLLECSQCSEPQIYIEREATDILLKETSTMAKKLISLMIDSRSEQLDERN